MKKLIILILGVLPILNLFGQNQICGKYLNHLGQKLELRPDSSFLYEYRWGLACDEVVGKWEIKNDTLYLNEVITYDTIYYKDTTELISGTLIYFTKKKMIRSEDDKIDVFYNRTDLLNVPSIPRNKSFDIRKLYIKRNKLFKVRNIGEIKSTKKIYAIRKKKYTKCFFKQKEDKKR